MQRMWTTTNYLLLHLTLTDMAMATLNCIPRYFRITHCNALVSSSCLTKRQMLWCYHVFDSVPWLWQTLVLIVTCILVI